MLEVSNPDTLLLKPHQLTISTKQVSRLKNTKIHDVFSLYLQKRLVHKIQVTEKKNVKQWQIFVQLWCANIVVIRHNFLGKKE